MAIEHARQPRRARRAHGTTVAEMAAVADDLVAEAGELSPLAVRGDVADLLAVMPAGLLEQHLEIVVSVEAPVDQVDAYSLPGQGLPNGLEIGQNRGLFLEELAP